MAEVIHMTLWEVIGIVSGVFFSMIFLILLGYYLCQVNSHDARFSTIDDDEHGNRSHGNSILMNCILTTKQWCSNMDDKIKDLGNRQNNDSQATPLKMKKKKVKTKIKSQSSVEDHNNDSDEEACTRGSSSIDHGQTRSLIVKSTAPSKTQSLYAGTSKKRIDYNSSRPQPDDVSEPPPPPNVSHVSNTQGVVSREPSDMDLSTSFSGRVRRKHPSQLP